MESILPSTRYQRNEGKTMKLLKYATLLAIAAVPLLLIQKKTAPKDETSAGATVDTDKIFDYDLKAD